MKNIEKSPIDLAPVMEKVRSLYGSQRAFARRLKISPSNFNNWQQRGVPARMAWHIEQVTEGEIKRTDLRPDLFRG